MATSAVKTPYIEAAAPATPAAGQVVIYSKSDGLMYSKDDAGVETLMSGGAGGGSVATDAIWDAAGDLAVGTGANTAARMAIGAAGGHVSRINGAVAWNSGTANPTATTGDRFWRTDLGLECYYNGTRWLSTTLYREAFSTGDSFNPTALSTIIGRLSTWGSDHDIWLEKFYATTYTATTNDGSNYWTVTAYKENAAGAGTSIASFTTAADTVNNDTVHTVSIGALLANGTYRGYNVVPSAKTGTPGDLYIAGAALTYRLVIT